ncbi:MAG: hypothetical protein IIB61_00305 [Planctomycetes bacterium]|nr:hypothetical protein [Planctomycetota bacterium]
MCAQDRPSGDSEWQIFGDSGAENDSPVVATAPDGAIVENIYCLQCGYNLRGLSGDPVRCPECGEKNSLGSAAIPARHIERALRSMETAPTWCVAFSLPTGLFLALASSGIEQASLCLAASAVCILIWWWLCRLTRTEFDGQPGWRKILISFHVAAAFSIFETCAVASAVVTLGRGSEAMDIYLALPIIGIPLLIWGWQIYQRARDELRSMQRDTAVRIAKGKMYSALRR